MDNSDGGGGVVTISDLQRQNNEIKQQIKVAAKGKQFEEIRQLQTRLHAVQMQLLELQTPSGELQVKKNQRDPYNGEKEKKRKNK